MSLFGNIFAKVRVMTSSVVGAGKAILVNLERGDPASPSDLERAGECVSFGPFGVYGRPEPPTRSASGNLAAGECEALCARSMDGFEPIVYRDLRIARRMNPGVGELGMAHYGGGYLSLRWDRARSGTELFLSAPHLSSDAVDESHYLAMDPSDDGNSVILAHRGGQNVTLNKSGAVTITSAGGKGSITVQDGDTGDPNVIIGGALALVGGIIAGSTDAAQPVAISQPFVDLLTDLLAQLAIAFAAPTPAPGAPLYTAWGATVVPALQARLAALSSAGTSQTLKASPT